MPQADVRFIPEFEKYDRRSTRDPRFGTARPWDCSVSSACASRGSSATSRRSRGSRYSGLSIRYRNGLAEDLRERRRYDVVFAVDVLVHVEDL
jgi:hypothetical protein